MNLFKQLSRLVPLGCLAALAALAAAPMASRAAELALPEGMTLNAAGWLQAGVVGHSSDTVNYPNFHRGAFNGKSVFSPGAQIELDATLSERLRVVTGAGVVAGNSLPYGPLGLNGGYALPGVSAYVSNAYFDYAILGGERSGVSLTGGLFPYVYNPDVKNLGLYLTRGTVYPGYLLSGFEMKQTLPVANTAGLRLSHRVGGFRQDFLLVSEMEYYPFFDLSPVYVATWQAHPALRVGAGVNFYHRIAVDRRLTNGLRSDGTTYWSYIDTSGTGAGGEPDTTRLGYSGTKLMANASFDPKPLFGGAGWLGPEDLKLYGEVALIGLADDKAHRKVYGGYAKRLPVMLGFNLPTWKRLDHLSLEVEWYGSDAEDNLDNYTIQGSSHPVSPFPTNWNVFNQTYTHRDTRDNVKWSLHGARMIQSHIQLSFQVANDHYRPGVYHGYGDANPPYQGSVMVAPRDWNAFLKLAYFFR